MSSVEIEASDVIKVVLQFLKEHNLFRSFRVLQEETQTSLNVVEDVDRLVTDVRHGRWGNVLDTVATVKIESQVEYDLFEQMVLEFAELGERDVARSIMTDSTCMQRLEEENYNRYLRLANIVKRVYFDPKEAYAVGTNKERRRYEIGEALRTAVSTVPPSRLMALIQQALKWQKHVGILPKGTQYDLLRGGAPTERDRQDKFPTRNSAVCKYRDGQASSAIFTPDGEHLLAGSADGFIEVWDYDSGKRNKELPYQRDGHLMEQDNHSNVTALACSRDGTLFASGAENGCIKVWRLATGTCPCRFSTAHEATVTSLEFNIDGTQILSASLDHTAKIHGLKSKRMLKQFALHDSFVNKAIYSADNEHVLTASSDGTVKCWNVKTSDCLYSFQPNAPSPNPSEVKAILLSPTHHRQILILDSVIPPRIVLADFEGNIITTFSTQKNQRSTFIDICLSPRGKLLYALGDDRVLYCFSLQTSKLAQVLRLHGEDVRGVTHHPHRNIMASFAVDHTLKVWRPK